MRQTKKEFLVRCTTAQYALLERRAAECGYASPTARAPRPGVARYLVDRGLSGGCVMTDDDRVILRRILWALRDASAQIERLAIADQVGSTETPDDATAALQTVRDAARLVSACGIVE